MRNFECLERVVAVCERACGAWSDYSLHYAGVLQRACDSDGNYTTRQIEAALSEACPPSSAPPLTFTTDFEEEAAEEAAAGGSTWHGSGGGRGRGLRRGEGAGGGEA